jgi:mannose-6-phosphate isomerase-like protein (cupin superfamily)
MDKSSPDYRLPEHIPHRPHIVPKGWGQEEWVHNDGDYCGKVLTFNPGRRCSLHFHVEKKETFYVLDGRVNIMLIDRDGSRQHIHLGAGRALEIPRGLVHQISNYGPGQARIMEVSTLHQESDSYRIERGD